MHVRIGTCNEFNNIIELASYKVIFQISICHRSSQVSHNTESICGRSSILEEVTPQIVIGTSRVVLMISLNEDEVRDGLTEARMLHVGQENEEPHLVDNMYTNNDY